MFLAHRPRRTIVHFDDLFRVDNAQTIGQQRQFGTNPIGVANQNNMQMRKVFEAIYSGGKRRAETVVSAHDIECNAKWFRQQRLFVVAGLNYFLTAVKTIGGHVMATMSFAAGGIDGQCRASQCIVRATHIAT
jgi:hypothetical protein